MILGMAFVADREAIEAGDAFVLAMLHPNMTLSDIKDVDHAFELDLPSPRALLNIFVALALAVVGFAVTLFLLISLRESGVSPDMDHGDDRRNRMAVIKRSLHVHTWYSFNRWLVLLSICLVITSLIMLFFAASYLVNFKYPHYSNPEFHHNQS